MNQEKNKNIIDFFVALVIISSISLRNYQYLLYIIQLLFIVFCARPLLKSVPKKFFLIKWLLFSWILCSILWADSIDAVISVLPSILQIFIITIILSGYINSTEKINKILKIFTLASIVLIINLLLSTSISEWQYIFSYSSSEYVDISSSAGRLGSSINMHPNAFGSVLIICFLCNIYSFFQTKQKKFLFLSIIILSLLILSKSRASIIEAIVGLFLFYILKQKNSIKKGATITVSLILGIILLWSIFNIPYLYNIIGYRMEGLLNIFTQSTSSNADASTTARLEFMQIGFELFLKHPLCGVGMNNFSVIAYRDYSIWAQVSSHNNYIEILSCLGIVGFILYYGIYIKTFTRLFKILKNKTIPNNIYMLTAFLMTLLLTIAIMGISHITYDNECIQYIALLIYCGSYILTNQTKHEKK